MPTQTTTVRTTTTSTRSSSSVLTVDCGYMLPHGILKLLEVIFCIVIMAMVADQRGVYHEYSDGYYPLLFCLIAAIVFFLTTLFLLIMFLCACPDRCCGRRAWYVIDLVHNIFAVVCFVAAFVILCIFCDHRWRTVGGWGYYQYKHLLIGAIFSGLVAVLYLLSIVFGMRTCRITTITVRT